jgi:Zn-dependent M28 family amino/carboxypeptidase
MRDNNMPLARIDASAIRAVAMLLLVGCQGASPPAEENAGSTTPPVAASISAARLQEHVARISEDRTAGRSPGSPGARLARQYLAETMESLGLEPAFSGSWEQPIELVGVTSQVPATWTFSHAGGQLDLANREDFIAGSGVQETEARIERADLVFVGYGIQAPEYQWDDFAGADLTGKVLLMLNNDPEWDPDLFAGERRLYYGRWDYKYESAARQGAVGAIILHTTPSAGYPWQVVQTSWSGPQFELPAGDEPRLQIASWVTEDAARRLVGLAGEDLDELIAAARSRDFRPVDLGIETSLDLAVSLERAEGANVGGLLAGADPELADQLVVYSAHYDHLGVGEPNDAGDDIYNGALDNASGCAAVLTIAEAFVDQPQPPSRSLLFLFVDAEEQGLLGSEYFALHPTVPPGRIAANLNIDGANIWGATHDVGVIGYGKSSLDALVERIASRQGRTVKSEQFPDRGFYYRSDQFNFAKIGVPAIYLDTGTEFVDRPAGWGKEQIESWEAVHYHQPSDELEETWNFDGFVQDTQLMFEAGLEIANSSAMPAWNPDDEFEATRLEALAALQ